MPSFCTSRWPRWTTRSLWPRKPFVRRLLLSLQEQDLHLPLHKYARFLPLTPICPSISVGTAALEGESAKCATTKLQSCVWLVMWHCASFPSATVSLAGITQIAAVRMRQSKGLSAGILSLVCARITIRNSLLRAKSNTRKTILRIESNVMREENESRITHSRSATSNTQYSATRELGSVTVFILNKHLWDLNKCSY